MPLKPGLLHTPDHLLWLLRGRPLSELRVRRRLQLSKVRQQRQALVHPDESAIDDETVRRQNRR
jgi:hypothetical protein